MLNPNKLIYYLRLQCIYICNLWPLCNFCSVRTNIPSSVHLGPLRPTLAHPIHRVPRGWLSAYAGGFTFTKNFHFPLFTFHFRPLDRWRKERSTSSMNPTSNTQNPKSKILRPPSHFPIFTPFTFGPIKNPKSKFLAPLTPEPLNPLTPRRRLAAFTLIELLVVISIIGLLAGLAVPAINGALKSAKKSEVSALTQSIRTALLAWNSEYGTWPTQNLSGGTTGFETTKDFYNRMATTNDSTNNPRAIIFLEVPAKFLDSQSNIVTPSGFIKGSRPMLRFQVDGLGSGSISNVGYENTNLRTAVAVWAQDPNASNRSVGTWK